MSRSMPRRAIAAAVAVVLAATLSACAGGSGASSPIRLGWSGELPPLDPAASATVGSYAFLSQIYPSLLTIVPGEDEPVPAIAESAEWTAEGVYTVVLKPDLEFANGDALTSSDVKFSIERQLALQSEDGAWRQLQSIDSVDLVDETTVDFRFGTTADSRFPFVLAGPAGLVLDEEAFFADELTPDEDILDAEPFGGPFSLSSMRGDVLLLSPYAGFGGNRRALASVEVHPGDGVALTQQLRERTLDVITGRFDDASLEALSDDDDLEMSRAASGRVRLLAFDFAHMPYGARTETPDANLALAVRGAIADVLDRDALADELGADWIEPLTGYLPNGIPGATDVFSALRGDREGGPDVDAATALLAGAGIVEPVELTLHVDLDQVGFPAADEVAAIAAQLDESGLFEVTVIETDAEGLSAALLAGEVQAMFTSLLPADADPQDYLAPFRSTSVAIPGYADANVDTLLARQVTELDPEVRAATVLETQNAIAAQLPAIPVSQGVRVVFSRSTIDGAELEDSAALDLSRLRR
jgi:peptide/nickel transport system substrate-binding protein